MTTDKRLHRDTAAELLAQASGTDRQELLAFRDRVAEAMVLQIRRDTDEISHREHAQIAFSIADAMLVEREAWRERKTP